MDCFYLAWLYWDPPREAFTIPFLGLSVAWYGILFAGGFIAGYFILLPLLTSALLKRMAPELLPASSTSLSVNSIKKLFPEQYEKVHRRSIQIADRLTWFLIIGTIIGARLGHVFFYDWPYYEAHPWEILMIRKGGLASHGGTLGVLISLLLFFRWNRKHMVGLSLISLFDLLAIPTSFAVFCIRLGNFFNQEILGYETHLPWAVIFGHPAEAVRPLPRHPTQLYEGAVYLATFCLLYILWKIKGKTLKPGTLSGIFFILVFGSRFFIEFLKLPQSMVINESFLQMGQYLSIPFIFLGIALLVYPKKQKSEDKDSEGGNSEFRSQNSE